MRRLRTKRTRTRVTNKREPVNSGPRTTRTIMIKTYSAFTIWYNWCDDFEIDYATQREAECAADWDVLEEAEECRKYNHTYKPKQLEAYVGRSEVKVDVATEVRTDEDGETEEVTTINGQEVDLTGTEEEVISELKRVGVEWDYPCCEIVYTATAENEAQPRRRW